jgi:hypothetical protein
MLSYPCRSSPIDLVGLLPALAANETPRESKSCTSGQGVSNRLVDP